MNKKTIFISIAVIILLAAGYAYMTYNKPHQSVDDADFSMEASQLISEFEQDEAKANEKYLDKVIEVKGPVKDVIKDENSVTLLLGDDTSMSSVSCALSKGAFEEALDIKTGNIITVKGICSGMLLDVALTNCVVAEE